MFIERWLGLIYEKTEVLYAELNEIVEAATGSYYVTGDSLQFYVNFQWLTSASVTVSFVWNMFQLTDSSHSGVVNEPM